MPDEAAPASAAAWPIPKFHFKLEVDGMGTAFQEVSGLNGGTQVLEYREGDSKSYSPIKMPGMMRFDNVIIKKGVFKGDNKLWDWFSKIKMNTIERKPVTISLLDEEGNPTMVWKLQNAFPVKISGTELNSTTNEVAVESLELAHEGFTMENGGAGGGGGGEAAPAAE